MAAKLHALTLRSLGRSALTTASLLGAGLSCSLTGVADFELPECQSDAECMAALNEEAGYPAECVAFKCLERSGRASCVEVALDGEICDGQDNDCDLLIDEPEEGETLLGSTFSENASGLGKVTAVSAAVSERFNHLYAQGDKTVTVIERSSASPEGAGLFTSADPENPGTSLGLVTEITEGCRRQPSGEVRTNCSLNDSMVAASGDLSFFASLNTDGCGAGELRVGAIDDTQPSQLIDRGPAYRSPSYLGVSATPAGCSANTRPECQAAIDEYDPTNPSSGQIAINRECGLSSPSLATLTPPELDDVPEDRFAIVTFLEAGLERPFCGGEEIDISALGLFGRTGNRDGLFSWADPTGDGRPDHLGRTTGSAPVPGVGLDSRGIFFAHGSPDSTIALSWIPRQPAPPKNDGVSCGNDCESRAGVSTDSLTGMVGVETLPTAGSNGDALAIALVPLNEGAQPERIALGLAWYENCTSDATGALASAEAFFQVLHVNLETTEPEVVFTGPRLALGVTQRAPIAAAETDFVVQGLERNGQLVEEHATGGFTVVISGADGPVGRRVAAFDGAWVDDEERITLGTADQVVLASIPGEPGRLIRHDPDAGSVATGGLSCE